MSGMQGYAVGAIISALLTLYGLRYEPQSKRLIALLFDLFVYTILYSSIRTALGT